MIVNHPGVLKMFAGMKNWSGKEEYDKTEAQVYQVEKETAGYIKTVANLRLISMRNAGHMVPRSQPKFSLDMFQKFITKSL